MNPRNRLLPFSILIVLIVTLTPGNGKIAGDYLDKVGHFAIFFFLAINILYKYKSDNKLIPLLLLAIVAGPLTEIAQQYIPGRNMEMYDVIADILGVFIAYYVYKTHEINVNKMLFKCGA